MQSMDDMMNMSFDDLRSQVAPNASVMPQMGSMMALSGGTAGPSLLAGPRTVSVPDHRQELQVFFHGAGAEAAARDVAVVDTQTASAACKGKRDFILFEDLDEALKEGRRLVLVLPLGAGRGELGQAQAYLASSLARWLSEQKTDGSGRPYGECKDEDPTLRKHFTRAQILAIKQFGDDGNQSHRR